MPGARSGLLVSAVAGALLLAACDNEPNEARGEPPPPPAVTVAHPVVKKIVEDDEFVGRFDAVSEVEVRARIGGYLQTIQFVDGDIVEQGDLLFTIDSRPVEAALAEAQAELESALAALNNTRDELNRAEQLLESGNISIQTVDERRLNFLAAQARVAAAEAAVQRGMLDLEYTQISAPLTGRIDRNYLSEGNLVEANATVLTSIVSTDPIYFYFDIDERTFLAYADDARARGTNLQEGSGLPVVITLADNGDSVFPGELDFSENRVDPESGTMRVRAVVPNPDLILLPGLFGQINVPGSLPYDGILLPDEAIASDMDRRIVFVVDEEGVVSAKQVRLGPRIDGYRVIRDGLTGDELIVVAGLMRVRPGATVTPEIIELPDIAE
ncbi:MAG: efflux RND transporter periplasmic adaptor subunit [Pseudomonadota bacterium]